ncbi:glycoside hydrolase family 10 protein [Arcticibacterium luteifluviistationis]|uniref:Glycoside hydrolase n=1 Tax=Arcticibacterium luteifluviistationis TaxID=1784714 RepID=A0A2Z4GD67_9BACT|nr:family 10 glycosylhydrolase [Arcticibacterium luteifluviistationis]AWV98965.1 glycoside hydrolase [Arcticibacterium luteifluviistationis]
MLKLLASATILIVLFYSCSKKPLESFQKEVEIPEFKAVNIKTSIPKSEFRGAWVATIANIDWPSQKGLNSETQKKEFQDIVKHHKKRGINALLVQVRAASDAFYAKSKEPWSEWLMGEQGKGPQPFYDPLEFMIEEAHQEGLEFHAWLNLNRGKHRLAGSVMPNHLIYTKPEWFISYGDYELYNFGLPEVRSYIIDVVMNIVREYDVDGIHFDDYFYPYKVTGLELEDHAAFAKYPNGFRSIEDWRRNNIDLVIKGISDAIKREKSWVSFGISPFGVWRNKSDDPLGSETRGGQPSYDLLFADTRKWAMEGWIDYIAPQIYFPFEHNLVPYGTLTDWWTKNHGKAKLYIGHGVYRVEANSSTKAWKDPNQIPRQLDYNRYSSGVDGSIFYNTNTFIKNNLGLADSIATRYKYPALVPEVNGVAKAIVQAPKRLLLTDIKEGLKLTWANETPKGFKNVVYRFKEGQELNAGDPEHILAITLSSEYVDKTRRSNTAYIYMITAVNRWNKESEPIFIRH